MRNPPKIYIVFLFVFLSFGSGYGVQPFWPDTVVTMTNLIENQEKSGPPLTVHCKSKQDDLGSHMVPFKQDYHFKFQTNIWKTTLFFCTFQWDKQFKQFDIFDALRDQDVCYLCNWTIKADGACRLGKEHKCFPWK
ncbi:unnamed protein product [Arabidopsis halleri]